MRRSRERCPARLIGSHKPVVGWAYREVRRRPARAAARAPRGAALRTGRKGERNTSPGSGCESTQSGSEERPGTGKTPRWSAGWRAPYVIGRARLARRACYQDALIGAPLPLFYRETEKRTRRCAPASRQRGGGALAFFLSARRLPLSPCGRGWRARSECEREPGEGFASKDS